MTKSPQMYIKSQGKSSKTPNIEFFTADIGLWFPQRFLRCNRGGYLSKWSYWRIVSYIYPKCCCSAAVLRDIRDSCHETCDAVCAVRHTAAVLQPALLHRPSWTHF